ncbi:hypothetical protein FLPS103535_06070 [Flavobacterium psychrophilum]
MYNAIVFVRMIYIYIKYTAILIILMIFCIRDKYANWAG